MIKKIVKKILERSGYDVESIGSRGIIIIKKDRRSNTWRDTSRWVYQKKIVESHLTNSMEVILDIGSGHAPVPPANILADFFDESLLHRASQELVEDRPVVICSVERMPFREKSIDFIVCSHILEHVDSPIRAAKELGRVGKAGYIETPAYGKDIIVGTGKTHRWQIVEAEEVLYFFEYSKRQMEGNAHSPLMDLWLRNDYHPWQDYFGERQDLFNAMQTWQNSPSVIEYRRGGGHEMQLSAWKPIDEKTLPERESALTPTEIQLLERILVTPDRAEAMKFNKDKFLNKDGTIVYHVRGKRIYFERAQ